MDSLAPPKLPKTSPILALYSAQPLKPPAQSPEEPLFFQCRSHQAAVMLRGDLERADPFNTDYMLFRNAGSLRFRDEARARGLARLGFGWGVVFADMDLDGRLDVLAAQNYVRLPLNALMLRYPGKLMLQRDDGSFASAEAAVGVENRVFAIAPVVADFNGDGRPDLVWANLNGRARAFLNEGPAGNGIGVRLANVAAALNAHIEVRAGARRSFGQVIANQGLGSDQTRTQFFGLGDSAHADAVIVTLQNGEVREFRDVPAGSLLRVDPRS